MDNHPSTKLSEDSPSVQAHLAIIQAVIDRMAVNSTSTKAWCVTLVSAVLVLVADSGNSAFALVALIPGILFAALDAYYLALEKGFRNAYKEFVLKVHTGKLTTSDLFEITPKGAPCELRFDAIRSFSIWSFYGALTILIMIAWQVLFI